MKGLYYDKAKRTHFYEKRVPQDVLAILRQRDLNARAKWKETFPQSVGADEAEDRAIDLLARWKTEWNALLPKPQVLVYPGLRLRTNTPLTDEAFAQIAATLSVMFPGISLKCDNLAGREPVMVDKPQDGSVPVYPGEAPPYALPTTMKLADSVFTAAEAVELWVERRREKYKKATGKKARQAVERILRRLALTCGHPDAQTRDFDLTQFNLRFVTERDLARYEKALLGIEVEAGGWREHAMLLKAIFKLAFDKQKIASNPAAGLTYEKDTGQRDRFSEEQNAIILRAAMGHPDPVIRITTLICGFSGLRPHEVVEASLADFVVRDGELVLLVRDENREGDEKGLKTKQSRRFAVIHSSARATVEQHLSAMRSKHGDKGPLFDELKGYDGQRRKDASNKLGRWLHSIDGLILADDQSFYSFRHTVSSELDKHPGKVSDALAYYITGHAQPTVKRKRYRHFSVSEVAAAIAMLPDPFKSKPKLPEAA